MSSNKETPERIEVGTDDITITERGDVQIINVRLAETLKAAIEAGREGGASARGNTTNYICPTNAYCPPKAIAR